MARKPVDEATEEEKPPRRKPRKKAARPVVEEAKAQITFPLPLLCKIDYLATKHRKSRSEYVVDFLAEKVKVLTVTDWETDESEDVAAA